MRSFVMTKSEFLKLIDEQKAENKYEMFSPCEDFDLLDSKPQFKTNLPDELTQLLKETNGLQVYYSLSIWSLDAIISNNLSYWFDSESFADLYMPFDNLLFFADAGNGDLFAYRILQHKIEYNDIYLWNHENDSRVWVANNLTDFIKQSLTGEINF